MRQKSRRWNLQLRSDKSLEDLSRIFSPIIRGWINYYGSFYKSALYPTLRHLNTYISQMGKEEIEKVETPSNECGLLVGKNSQEAARVYFRIGSLA